MQILRVVIIVIIVFVSDIMKINIIFDVQLNDRSMNFNETISLIKSYLNSRDGVESFIIYEEQRDD